MFWQCSSYIRFEHEKLQEQKVKCSHVTGELYYRTWCKEIVANRFVFHSSRLFDINLSIFLDLTPISVTVNGQLKHNFHQYKGIHTKDRKNAHQLYVGNFFEGAFVFAQQKIKAIWMYSLEERTGRKVELVLLETNKHVTNNIYKCWVLTSRNLGSADPG